MNQIAQTGRLARLPIEILEPIVDLVVYDDVQFGPANRYRFSDFTALQWRQHILGQVCSSLRTVVAAQGLYLAFDIDESWPRMRQTLDYFAGARERAKLVRAVDVMANDIALSDAWVREPLRTFDDLRELRLRGRFEAVPSISQTASALQHPQIETVRLDSVDLSAEGSRSSLEKMDWSVLETVARAWPNLIDLSIRGFINGTGDKLPQLPPKPSQRPIRLILLAFDYAHLAALALCGLFTVDHLCIHEQPARLDDWLQAGQLPSIRIWEASYRSLAKVIAACPQLEVLRADGAQSSINPELDFAAIKTSKLKRVHYLQHHQISLSLLQDALAAGHLDQLESFHVNNVLPELEHGALVTSESRAEACVKAFTERGIQLILTSSVVFVSETM